MFRRSVPFLILATALVAFNFSLGMSRTIQGNFLVDELGVRPNEMAIVITARETVGFLTILLVAATMRFAPARLASVCFVVMGVGYYLYGVATSYLGVLPGVILASAGFHIWSTLSGAFGLAVAKEVNTYLKKVAAPGDVRPSLATGLTVMHIPALVVPILGGVLWNTFGYAVPFLVGCVFIVASLAATQLMPRRSVANATQPVVA